MPNPIKFSTGSESNALKKGNMFIGTGAVGKGPSDSTGYYQGPAVPSGGYVIYMNKVGAPGGLSYHSVTNNAELIAFTNSLAGQTFTTAQQCFNYYYGQSDKVLVNQDYPPTFPYIVLDGLVLYLDAGITQSYPGSGTAWSDINGLGPKNNGTLINGPTFNSTDGGVIKFDGVDDNCSLPTKVISAPNINDSSGQPTRIVPDYYPIIDNFTVEFVAKPYQSTSLRTESTSGFAGVSGQKYLFGSPKDADGAKGAVCISFGTNSIQIFEHGDNYMPCLLSYQITITTTQHYTLKYVNRKPSLYINGSLVREGLQSLKSLVSYSSESIGANGGFYNGVQADVNLYRIYNRVLTDAEILQNYNAQKGRFGL